MDSKIFHTLEYSKIIQQLLQHIATPMGERLASELVPSSELNDVQRSLQATEEAATAYRLKGLAPFRGIADIRPISRERVLEAR